MFVALAVGSTAIVIRFGFAMSPTAPLWAQTLDGAIFVGSTFGAILGGVQALVLRDDSTRAWWWVLVSAVGAFLGAGIGFAVHASTSLWFLAWLLAFVPYSIVTGSSLPWTLRHPQ